MKSDLLSVEEAQKCIQSFCQKNLAQNWPRELVPCTKMYNRVLAEDIVAESFQPAFDVSAMDGYAFRFEDFEKNNSFELIGESAAGTKEIKTLQPCSAMRIFTGGRVPEKADTVIMQEQTEKPQNKIILHGPVKKGDHIRVKGSEYQPGACIMKAGTILTEYHSGVMASLRRFSIVVKQKPVITIIQTGNELAEPYEGLQPHQITASNASALVALVEKAGAIPRYLGIVKDSLDELTKKISEVQSDIIITTGGVSVGDYDLVEKSILPIGFKRIFWKAAIKPGKPILFGHIDKTLFFGLPGNPISSIVCFDQFVKPAISEIMKGESLSKKFMIRTSEAIKKNKRKSFLLGKYVVDNEGGKVLPLKNQGSGSMSLFADANCYIITPEGDGIISEGSMVEIELL